MKPFIRFFLFFLLLTAGCQRTDFDAIRRKQEQQQQQLDGQEARITALEAAVKSMNTDIASLKTIAEALQKNISVRSYIATPAGYLLTMSDGSTLTLTHGKDGANGRDGKDGQNGKDGLNAPVIGVKKDTDGQYYWTLGGDFIIQNGQKLRVTGNDGADGIDGMDGANGITPQLRADGIANQWLISYDGGGNWQVVKDAAGNIVPVTGPQGPVGPAGQDGIQGFSMEDKGDYVIISYVANGLTQSYSFSKLKTVWVAAAAGGRHTLLLTNTGDLYAMGLNGAGQLGLGDHRDRNQPAFVMDNVKAIAAGELHSLVLKTDGRLYAMGLNFYGQLGLSDNQGRIQPTLVPDVAGGFINQNVEAIAAGGDHSLILQGGRVYAMGRNLYGQLGLSDNQDRNQPTLVPDVAGGFTNQNVEAIAAGGSHSLILQGGKLYAVGWNTYGQLGLGDDQDRNQPTLLPDMPGGFTNSDIRAMAGGFLHSLVLKSDGSLYAMGDNRSGAFGEGPAANIRQPLLLHWAGNTGIIAAGANNSFGTLAGQLYAMGLNDDGQLGLGDYTNRAQATIVPGFTHVKAIATNLLSSGFSILITGEGKAYATGSNNYGQLGIGTAGGKVAVFTPVKTPWEQ